MSTPRIEYIAANIATAVGQINVANGFNQDLTAIRPKRNDFKDVSPDDGTVLIWQGEEEAADEQTYNAQHWFQYFSLLAIVLDSDDAATSIDTRLNQVRADIQKKLRADPTRGGYAIDTQLEGSVKFDDGEGFTGIEVIVKVFYRCKQDDPYTAI